ncbi:MAG: RHS repeat-associated core domain-containing protein [Alphaproteobacteria bacterium]
MGRLYETAAGGGATTRFLYDGDALVAEYDASGTLLRRYAFGPNPDEPLLWDEGGALDCAGARLLHADHRGSIVASADCAGARLGAANIYDPYGVPGAANTGRFQFTGQAFLPELALYYYKARMYSPAIGRFMQTDPIGYDDQINLYAYVHNDPVNAIDPDGERTIWLQVDAWWGETPTKAPHGHRREGFKDNLLMGREVTAGIYLSIPTARAGLMAFPNCATEHA